MNALIPTTRPSTSTSGPPLLPGLIGVSVWMYTCGSSEFSCRATELMTPMVSELSIPAQNHTRPGALFARQGADPSPFRVFLERVTRRVHLNYALAHLLG